MRGGDGLLQVEPVEKKRPQGRPARADETFRAFDEALSTLLQEKIHLIDARIAGLAELRADLVTRINTACPLREAASDLDRS